jgi:hypothetical protein
LKNKKRSSISAGPFFISKFKEQRAKFKGGIACGSNFKDQSSKFKFGIAARFSHDSVV